MLVDTMLNKVRTITNLNFVNTVKVHTILSMESGKTESAIDEVLKLLVVGNNPIELSRVLDQIKKIDREKVVEIAFDFQSILDRLHNFKPDFILIDDNIGRAELRHVVDSLLSERRTRNIPITVLKNSNYREAISSGVMDFILKENLSGESIYRAFRNSLKVKKTQLYLYNSYKKRKGQLMRIFRAEPAVAM
jgi:PleD family two-component response regulator